MRLRLFCLMALQLAIWGAWAPKLFPYMTMLGFDPTQQALVGSSWGVASIAGIFFSNQFADRKFSGERFLAVSHFLSGICLFGAAFSEQFLPFYVCFLAYSLLYVPTMSVANSVTFANLKNSARDFGLVRMGGTVGWVIVSWPFFFLLAADASKEQVRWIFLISATISFALSAFALTLPHTPPRRDVAVDPLAWRRTIGLLKEPAIAALFLVTLIDSVVHNGYFVMADAFLTNRVGIAGNLSMIVLSLGQLAEMVTMAALGTVLAKLGWRTTMIIGIMGHAVRFVVFALFPDSIPTIIAVQFLHGICYAFFFATVYIFVDEAFPNDVRASAQGLFNLLILGVGNVVASFLFPALAARLTVTTHGAAGAVHVIDYQTLFLVPSGLALLGAVILAVAFNPITRGPRHLRGDDATTDVKRHTANA